MLGKVYIVLDFADEAQKEQVQEIFKEVSNMRVTNGAQIITFYPFIKSHQQTILQLFNLVKQNGVKAIVSMQGAALIKQLMTK